jgi:hypothetical protein
LRHYTIDAYKNGLISWRVERNKLEHRQIRPPKAWLELVD